MEDMLVKINFDLDNAYHNKGKSDLLNEKDIAELIYDTNKLSAYDRKIILASVIMSYIEEYEKEVLNNE